MSLKRSQLFIIHFVSPQITELFSVHNSEIKKEKLRLAVKILKLGKKYLLVRYLMQLGSIGTFVHIILKILKQIFLKITYYTQISF